MATSTESLPPPGWDDEGLDGLLDAFPKGGLSEIAGPRSSGGSSLLLALLARAAARGGLVALVDSVDAFDPAIAVRAGLDLRALLWVRCGGRLPPAWSAVDLLARCPGFAAVALDVGESAAAPPGIGVRLQRAVAGGDTMLVVRAPRHLLGSAAALVVSMRRMRARWVGAPRPARLGGLVSEARVLRSRGDPGLAASGRAWLLEWRA
jgi:RecA DNA recombination protein